MTADAIVATYNHKMVAMKMMRYAQHEVVRVRNLQRYRLPKPAGRQACSILYLYLQSKL